MIAAAPVVIEATVLDALREVPGALLTTKAVAVAVRRRLDPSSSLEAVRDVVIPTLYDLAHAGRVERVASSAAGVPVWRATFVDDELERDVLELRRLLGGRPVALVDGEVALRAPIELVLPLARAASSTVEVAR